MVNRLGPRTSYLRSVARFDPEAEVPKRPIPHPGRGRSWDRRSRQAWIALTSEPWTSNWSPSDVALATRWIFLQQAFWVTLDDGASAASLKSLNAELRAMESSLFASPASRQANRVVPQASRATRKASTLNVADLLEKDRLV